MPSWEDIANEIVPAGTPAPGLATGEHRTRKRGGDLGASLGAALGASRFLECPPVKPTDSADSIWQGREMTSDAGDYYFIDRAVSSYDPQNGDLTTRLEAALKNPPSRALEGLSSSDMLFCDIETAGLSSSEPLFLIGTLLFIGGQGRLQLYLSRQPNEEKAIISAFSKVVGGKTLITFNGKSFDWPYIEGRANRNLVRLTQPLGHFDVLFAARRRYRSEMPNCRLQTLEMGVCGRGRKGDIPSAQIPERYYDYLEMSQTPGKGAHLLAPILFHNALDVLTMAELICCMAEGK